MEEVKNLETQLEEIVARYDNLEEVGYDELNAAWNEIDEIKRSAYDIATNLLVGVTRGENGRFKSNSDVEFDINELAEITTTISKLTDRAYDEIHRINMEERRKKDLFFEKGKRRNELRSAIRTNDAMIASLETEIKNLKIQLGDTGLTEEMIADLKSRGITYTPNPLNLTPEKQYYLENELKAKQASLDAFKSANEMYKTEEEKLTEEMGILKNGGRLEEPQLDENLDLNRTDEQIEKTEPEVVPFPFPEDLEEKHEENDPEVVPVPFPVNPDEEEMTNETEPEVVPVPFPEDLEEKHEENDPEVVPVPFPVNPDEEDIIDRNEPEPIPFPGGDEELEENEPEVETTPEPEQEEEEEEYEATPAPLPLWKKVTIGLMTAATVFLGAIGVHTGIMARQQTKMADSLEKIAMVDTEKDLEEPDAEPEPEPEPTNPSPVNPSPVNPTPTNPTPTNPTPTDPTPTDPTPTDPTPTDPTPTDPTPTDPEEPPKTDYEEENGLPVHLDEGEVVYDEESGVSINDEGETYIENEDGSLTHVGNQDLEQSEQGSSIVGEDELNPTVPSDEPLTDDVKTPDELTDEELDSLEDALNGVDPEDALDEDVSNAHAQEATPEDYLAPTDPNLSAEAELDEQTNKSIEEYFSANGIFDVLNDGQQLVR